MALHVTRQRKEGGAWYARGTIRVGKRSVVFPEFSTGTASREEADSLVVLLQEQRRVEIVRKVNGDFRRNDQFIRTGRSTRLPPWAIMLWRSSKARAQRVGLEFGLDEDDMAAMVERAGGKCEISAMFHLTHPCTRGSFGTVRSQCREAHLFRPTLSE